MASERETAVSKEKTTTGDAKLREALVLIANTADCLEASLRRDNVWDGYIQDAGNIRNIARDALAAPPHTGKWKNGKEYEYEYAYCSECSHMQWAGWNSHEQAEERIESFANNYRFCPGCGAKMEGGIYVK